MRATKFFLSINYTLLVSLLIFTNCTPNEKQADSSEADKWTSLWNGKDFIDWVKFLARPHHDIDFPGLERGEDGKYVGRVGLNNDPLDIFSVVQEDGEPAIRVSGEVFGTISTVETFENYHLKLQFKWGTQKHPPRANAVRDSGLLYHCFGGPGSTGGAWPNCQEFQIQERDLGDFWAVGDSVKMDAPTIKVDTLLHQYDPDGEMRSFFHQHQPKQYTDVRIIKLMDNEKNNGEWNNLDLICYGDSSIFVVNGEVVNRLYNSKRRSENGYIKLSSGNISLQSEGAELYYRKIFLRKIAAIPKKYQMP
ncbi:DUF1080 domain-containing protein [Fulvivirgaceae bacterium BMA12]|uniref:DUF1080 domain-containing protein n=1 Tax=Agaribacillus aureus TaxID=3051825 RepID=A0ABT8LCQ3_9BACT|nr:DUF1080 domain-containing protein [Fulvivirgaceae bacterium BMA12]